tara:strand:+ start:60314 stop:60532 length:219 start_codon:yes stop_codon:yes gene_type:complete
MKIYKIAQAFNDLPVGSVILSDLYRREGNIELLERIEKPDNFGGIVIKYKAFFPNSGRQGTIDARDITSVIS